MNRNIIGFGFTFHTLLFIFLLSIAGCVFWRDPLDPIEFSELPPVNENFSTITVVRKKQFATSACIFTISIDGRPIVNLENGQYTRFRWSPNDHLMTVTWTIRRLHFIIVTIAGGGIYEIPESTFDTGIHFQCKEGADCFIAIEGKAFAYNETDRVIIKQVEKLEGEFSLEGKTFVLPGTQLEK